MCDTAVALTDDGVLFAKNSDRDPNESQVLDWRPAADHPTGARLRATWIEIDQVAHTHAVLLSRPFWMWGAEMGANEHHVVIGNEAVFTDQPYADEGLTGMDLLRLALERATTAEEAVEVIVGLLEAHGQGGGCGHEDRSFTYHNSFLVADPDGAVVLETAGGLWATEEVDAPGRSISNGLTIPGFAEAHADRLRTRVSGCRVREARTAERVARASSPGDLMTMLRDHGPGRSTPHYSWLNGGLVAPCVHAGGLVASSQTTASWVADLTGAPLHWVTGTASPCTSLFKPARVDRPVDVGPEPGDTYDPSSLWWRHERWSRRALRDPVGLFPLFTGDREATELAWLADPPSSTEAFSRGDDLIERWTTRVETSPAPDRRPPWARRYWQRRNRRAEITVGQRTGSGG